MGYQLGRALDIIRLFKVLVWLLGLQGLILTINMCRCHISDVQIFQIHYNHDYRKSRFTIATKCRIYMNRWKRNHLGVWSIS